MPLPIILAALATTGTTILPHYGGGLILYNATLGGYLAGTYLSTATIATYLSTITGVAAISAAVSSSAIGAFVGTAATAVGGAATAVGGAASAVVGSSGIFGTTIGASGVTGTLMSVGVLPATPIVLPASIALLMAGGGYLSYRFLRLKNKINSAKNGEEVIFTEKEASIIEAIIRKFG